MRLLFLIHRLPCPPDRGAKLRAAALLDWLARRHELWCAGFLDPPAGREHAAQTAESLARWRGLCREVSALPLRPATATCRALAGLTAGGTATENYFRSARLERQIADWGRRIGFDAVLAFSSSMAPAALSVPAPRRVLVMDDLDSRKWAQSAARSVWPARQLYALEASRLADRERAWIAAFDATVLVSRREAEAVTDPALRARVHVIPAGAGAGFGDAPAADPPPLPDDDVVGFVGAMDYEPNIDAARWLAGSIWPLIRARRPSARLWIVGRSPTRAVRRLDGRDGIRVTGTVPDVGPWLAGMCVHVAPLRLARGVQIKVLSAMAAARPCVVTPEVAEGLGADPGRDLLVASGARDIAGAVVDLLEDRMRARTIGLNGLAFVREGGGASRGLLRLEELLGGNPGDTGRPAHERTANPAAIRRVPASGRVVALPA